MKKYPVTILVLLSMLVIHVGVVSAAPAASGTITLVGVEYVPGKGPVFTFNVSGNFSKGKLKGTLHVEGGADYDLHCTQVDEDTVKCNASQKVAGANVSVTWGGSTFWAYVPEAPPASTEYCYSVYDWNFPGPYVEWVNFGTYCQDTPATYGDVITWYNPGWNDTFDYEFLPESPNPQCSFHHSGDAYYYPLCPI